MSSNHLSRLGGGSEDSRQDNGQEREESHNVGDN